jgi:hypothetical protein
MHGEGARLAPNHRAQMAARRSREPDLGTNAACRLPYWAWRPSPGDPTSVPGCSVRHLFFHGRASLTQAPSLPPAFAHSISASSTLIAVSGPVAAAWSRDSLVDAE